MAKLFRRSETVFPGLSARPSSGRILAGSHRVLLCPPFFRRTSSSFLVSSSDMGSTLAPNRTATSPAHTPIRIAPAFPQPVVHIADPSRAAGIARGLLSDDHRPAFHARHSALQEELHRDYAYRQCRPRLLLSSARAHRRAFDWTAADLPAPVLTRVRVEEAALADLVPYVEWSPFFRA